MKFLDKLKSKRKGSFVKPEERKGKGFKKITLVALLLVAMGGGLFYYSYGQIQEYLKPKVDYVSLPVPKKNIPVYTIISSADFEMKAFPKGTEKRGYLMEISQLSGLTTARPLERNAPVMEKYFLDKNETLSGIQIVNINMDASRAASAKPGDSVDVYLLNAASPVAPGELIARAVKVVDVCDTSGQSLYAEGSVLSDAVGDKLKSSNKTIYRIAVKNTDVSKVITGSSARNDFIAFTRYIDKVQSDELPMLADEDSGEETEEDAEKEVADADSSGEGGW